MAFILLIGLGALCTLSYSYWLGSRAAENYEPLVDAAMEIQLETTKAHLWFEEILSGDSHEYITQVFLGLDEADWYTKAMLEGGERDEIRFRPLDIERLRHQVQTIQTDLAALRESIQRRWNNKEAAGPGTQSDQQFDRDFKAFIAKVRAVENELQTLSHNALIYFHIGHIFLLFCTLAITLLIAHFFRLFMQRQSQAIQLLEQANSELNLEVAKRKKAEELLQHQATTDALTGTYNRRKMTELLEAEQDRAERYGQPLSLVMVDIDRFKQINDHYGHDIGDETLMEVTRRLSSITRLSDSLARWGGEEFLILLPNTSLDGAQEFAERCRRCISREAFDKVGQVTASFGVAQFKLGEDDTASLLKSADNALYQAKEEGRNRVIAAKKLWVT